MGSATPAAQEKVLAAPNIGFPPVSGSCKDKPVGKRHVASARHVWDNAHLGYCLTRHESAHINPTHCESANKYTNTWLTVTCLIQPVPQSVILQNQVSLLMIEMSLLFFPLNVC